MFFKITKEESDRNKTRCSRGQVRTPCVLRLHLEVMKVVQFKARQCLSPTEEAGDTQRTGAQTGEKAKQDCCCEATTRPLICRSSGWMVTREHERSKMRPQLPW